MDLSPLPEGTRLVHIGPGKTGTTALQSAFHHNRAALAEHGVRYAGPWLNVRPAVRGVSQHTANWRSTPGSERRYAKDWKQLVDEVAAATESRVVISSEAFAHCEPAEIGTVLDAFGSDCCHVVITMRPLGDLLPSAWQQSVQGGAVMPYERWLRRVLVDDPEGSTFRPGFWRRTRIDRLAEHWGESIGADRVTVISLAEQRRDFVLRVFERLTALPVGTLVPDPAEANPSLPYQAVEVFRHFNALYKQRGPFDSVEHGRLVETGAVRLLKAAGPDVLERSPFPLPDWAAERCSDLMGTMNARLTELGVNVIGDLAALTRSTAKIAPAAAPTEVSVQDAAQVVLAMMEAARSEGYVDGRRSLDGLGWLRRIAGGMTRRLRGRQ